MEEYAVFTPQAPTAEPRGYAPSPEESTSFVPLRPLTKIQAEMARHLLTLNPAYRWFRNRPVTQSVCGVQGYWLSRTDDRGCDLLMFRDPEDLISALSDIDTERLALKN